MKKNKGITRGLEILLFILLGGVMCKILVPYVYSFFIYILGLGINIFTGVIIGGSIISIIGVLGMLSQCIKRENVYEINGNEYNDNSDYMRSQLYVVKENEKEEKYVNEYNESKYTYLFDNEYRDNDNDNMIDDFYYETLGNVGYSRCKRKYKGRYLR